MNVGVWLNAERARVFRRHVPKGQASQYGAQAIEEKLRREGAWDEPTGTDAAAVLKSVPAEARPVLLEIAELLAVRPEAVKAAIAEIKADALEAAASEAAA